MSTDHSFCRKRRAEADLNRGPSAYQSNALPLGQTGVCQTWQWPPLSHKSHRWVSDWQSPPLSHKSHRCVSELAMTTSLPQITQVGVRPSNDHLSPTNHTGGCQHLAMIISLPQITWVWVKTWQWPPLSHKSHRCVSTPRNDHLMPTNQTGVSQDLTMTTSLPQITQVCVNT